MAAEDWMPYDLGMFDDEEIMGDYWNWDDHAVIHNEYRPRYPDEDEINDDWRRFNNFAGTLGLAFRRHPEPNPLLRQAAESVVASLSDFGAYIYYGAVTGSQYIKFTDSRIGSIRISDHRGIEKYRYRWNLGVGLRRADRLDRGVLRHYYPISDLISFISDIRRYHEEINTARKSWHGTLDLDSLLP